MRSARARSPTIAADDCALFLWATVPMLPDALKVMAHGDSPTNRTASGPRTKSGQAIGFATRMNLLLVGTRGNIPAPAMGTQFPSVIEALVAAHSAKPEAFLEIIERYYPTLPKIELNRRGPARLNWDAWGNEVDALDHDPETGELSEAAE
jgi:N6-adenosine-specific RNA methylase IME4